MQLNPAKSEVLFVATHGQSLKFTGSNGLSIARARLDFASSVRSLGVLLDTRLSFNEHVTKLCQACNYHIRSLKHIRPMLTDSVALSVAGSIVNSRLDYCNALLYGTSERNISKLQRVQNAVARAVDCRPRRAHMRPVLAKFHWLPIRERLHYKMALLAYQGRVGLLPRYLSTLLSDYKPARTLRSGFGAPLLQTRRVRNELARRSFGVAVPAVWNALPPALRLAPSLDTFKAGLKSNLFREAFYYLL